MKRQLLAPVLSLSLLLTLPACSSIGLKTHYKDEEKNITYSMSRPPIHFYPTNYLHYEKTKTDESGEIEVVRTWDCTVTTYPFPNKSYIGAQRFNASGELVDSYYIIRNNEMPSGIGSRSSADRFRTRRREANIQTFELTPEGDTIREYNGWPDDFPDELKKFK